MPNKKVKRIRRTIHNTVKKWVDETVVPLAENLFSPGSEEESLDNVEKLYSVIEGFETTVAIDDDTVVTVIGSEVSCFQIEPFEFPTIVFHVADKLTGAIVYLVVVYLSSPNVVSSVTDLTDHKLTLYLPTEEENEDEL